MMKDYLTKERLLKDRNTLFRVSVVNYNADEVRNKTKGRQ